jgi:hypothetical protein
MTETDGCASFPLKEQSSQGGYPSFPLKETAVCTEAYSESVEKDMNREV